ncbi:MAG: hypothetical protein ACE5GA_00195, partial [Candidatus Zixiibacteriota bacterium]
MKRSQAIIFAILAFAFTIAQSQQSQRTNEMQELVIRGFQGGLITAVGDENMPDNALGAVENYVFTKNKYLYGPRWAFQLWNTTDTSSNDSDLIEALFAYYDDDTSKILAVMRNSADTLIKGTNQIVVLNKTNGTISEELFKFAYRRGLRANTDGIHWGRIHEDSVLYISNAKGQLMVYDGFKLYFAKPPGPGQPQAVTAGPGNLTGRYKYRYTYHQHDDTGVSPDTGHLDWETLFSIQSEPVYPFGERVYIYDLLPPRDTTKYNIILYRTKADGEVFYALDTIGDSTRVYTDNTADGSLGDTANYY